MLAGLSTYRSLICETLLTRRPQGLFRIIDRCAIDAVSAIADFRRLGDLDQPFLLSMTERQPPGRQPARVLGAYWPEVIVNR